LRNGITQSPSAALGQNPCGKRPGDDLAVANAENWARYHLLDRLDVSVGAEHVLRIPFALMAAKPLEPRAEGRPGAVGPLVLREEVEVGPPVENAFISFHAARAHWIFAGSSSAFSHEAAMLST